MESGLDDPDNPGHLSHFVMGQTGLIHTLNYMDATHIFNI